MGICPAALSPGALPLRSGLAPLSAYSSPPVPTPQVKECPSDVCAGRVTLFDLCQWFLFKLSTLLPGVMRGSFLSGPTDLAGVQELLPP